MKTSLFLVLLLTFLCLIISQNFNFGTIVRKWYVCGNFTQVISYNKTTFLPSVVNVGYVGQYDGATWTNMAGGVNGIVKSIWVDLCNFVYVAGAFTTAGTGSGIVTTGPLAYYNTFTQVWSGVGVAGISWGTNPVINAITVDCANVPTGQTCPCNVYVGGNFVATIGTNTATNIARFTNSGSVWDNLGGLSAHGLAPGEVRAIFKKDFGISQTPLKNLWVVGTFPKAFAKYSTATSAWGFNNVGTVTATNLIGNINTIKYSALPFVTDLMFLGGNFTWTLGGVTCTNLCQFNYQAETINSVVSQTWTPEIFKITIDGIQLFTTGNVYVGGSYSFSTYNYLSVVSSSSFSTNVGTIAQISPSNTTVLTQLIRAQWTCSTPLFGLVDCKVGSTAIGGDNGYLFYWNSNTQQWQTFGGGPLGSVYAIDSTVAGVGSLSLSFLVIVLIIFFI